MIPLIDVGKACEKTQHTILIKILSKTRNRRELPQLNTEQKKERKKRKRPTVNIILNCEKLEAF